MIGDFAVWLTQSPTSPKHTNSWKHPVSACLIHYIISSLVIILIHDNVIIRFLNFHDVNNDKNNSSSFGISVSLCNKDNNYIPTSRETIWVACISFVYALLLLSIRLLSNHPGVHRFAVLYEFTWLCNAALLLGGCFGLITCRPRIATGFAIAVSIDQILWYVDAFGYVYYSTFNRRQQQQQQQKFPVGVCKYLIWKQTQLSAKITCTHHFWTIPLLIYGAGGGGLLDWGSYVMNIAIVFTFVALSRWLTPFGLIPLTKGSLKDKQHTHRIPRFEKYLNVNLAHELWQDIKVSILRRHGDNQTMGVYILRLNLWWQLFNFLCFLLLKGVERTILSLFISK